MSWTAIVPVKPPADGKTRLAALIPADDRAKLCVLMRDHVLDVLAHVPAIAAVVPLCRAPPPGWTGRWIADRGRGLNAELAEAARGTAGALAIVHADLPALAPGDVSGLLAAAGTDGVAIAPDRHDAGTNAIAIARPDAARFAFGPGSLSLHSGSMPGAAIVRRRGLACDLDTGADADALIAAGDVPAPIAALLALYATA